MISELVYNKGILFWFFLVVKLEIVMVREKLFIIFLLILFLVLKGNISNLFFV